MSVDAITSQSSVASFLASQVGGANPTAAQLAADRQSLAATTTSSSTTGVGKSKASTPDDIKRASSQFEAIILRQMLAPTIEPIMSGGSGAGASGGGGGIYGYMVTDVLASSLSKGGGLGLAKMLEKQLGAKHPAIANPSDSISPTTKS